MACNLRCAWTSLCAVSLALAAGVACGAEIIVEENVVYAQAGQATLELDLARPAGEGPFPAIFFIHGGGWFQGSRDAYRQQIEQAARRGYVAATISYRLMQFDEKQRETATADPIFPAQVHDAKAAVRWLRAHATEYHVDTERIGATGASAGGHLSLMLGLTDPHAELEGEGPHRDQSSRVQAVVNFFGPTEMTACYRESSVDWIFRLFMGGTPEEAEHRYRAASPVTYISDDDPPVLTLHGDEDTLVPVAQAKLLDEKMKSVGASHALLVFKGQGHGFAPSTQHEAMDAMWHFFDVHLKGP